MEDLPSRVTSRPYRPGDEEAVLAAFNRAYAEIDPNFRPRSMDVWRWRYQENPAGLRLWVAVLDDGTVIAQQGGIPIDMVHDERRVHWVQVGDTFVDPRYARALRKPGLFYRVAKPFSDTYGGPPPKEAPVHYGMPTRRAYRIGKKQMDYQAVRNQNYLAADPERLHARAGARGLARIHVEEVDRFPDDVTDLFESARRGRGAIAVRDRTYLDWRFTAHPELDYSIALARRSTPGRELVGYAVSRRASFDGHVSPGGGPGELVCDWLVAPGEDEASRALWAWLSDRATLDGTKSDVICVLPETCPEFTAFQRAGFRVHPSGYYAVGFHYHGPYPMRWLYHHWYYTLADFDLC